MPRRVKKGIASLLLCLPLIALIPAYPALAVRWFNLREPTFLVPLGAAGPIQIRQDPYGSGLFGARRNRGRVHQGLDLVAPVGTAVLAAKSGVAMIGRKRDGMGRYVEIRHPDGWITRYGHLKEILIRDRRRIRRGDVVGTVGKSGNARSRLIQPHLHFEVWRRGKAPIDPLEVLGQTS